MTPAEVYQKLLSLREWMSRDGDEDEDWQEEDARDAEYFDLLSWWRSYRLSTIQLPKCCPMADNLPAVTSVVDEAGPHWHVGVHEELFLLRRRAGIVTIDFFAGAKFCPYCGERLPELALRDNIDLPVCEPGTGDDVGYCMTCKERLRNCLCMPPEYRYENAATPKEG